MDTIQQNDENLFCKGLPSKPDPRTGKILVTGASGYIGGRLVPELLARGYKVRILVRADSPEYKKSWPDAETAVGDATDIQQLRAVLDGIDTAYYLIHSLLLGPREFALTDVQAAINFRKAAEEKNVKRIIYLGGLGEIQTYKSYHLKSRMRVAEELKAGKVPVTILRAAVIIGSGSASYEIIQHLVRRLPILLIPHWARNRCQPIAVRDVIKYLVGVLEVSDTSGRYLDIGGRDILTYADMLKILADVLHKKTLFIPFFFSNIGFYSYFAGLLTPVPAPITRCLMEGLKDEVICHDNSIKTFLPFEPLSYKEAIVRAMSREQQDEVYTRWSDAYPPAHELAMKLHEFKDMPKYTAAYSIASKKSSSALFHSICRIGGKTGWFNTNWMWRLRGGMDKILLGVGSSRGRKSYHWLKVNDVIDFWRIEDIQESKRLLLRAEMKLPGKAWLEFKIDDDENERRLSVTAYYYTRSLFGHIYWYIFLPFHQFIFHDLIKQIEEKSA